MLRNPRKTLQMCNNKVTVSLPLTEIDIEEIIDRVAEAIGRASIADIEDVDLTTYGLYDGYVLVYDHISKKWQSTNYLDRQIVDGGEY